MTERMNDRALAAEACSAAEVGEGLKTVRLSPWGEVESTHGKFYVDKESAAAVIADFTGHGVSLPIDVEHETLEGRGPQTGSRGAVGWVEQIFAEAGRGLFALVKWSDQGRALIRDDRFRYLSPVFWIRKDDRKVVGLHSAALTTKPAIPRMERLAASANVKPEHMTDIGDIADALGVELIHGGAATLPGRLVAKAKELRAMAEARMDMPAILKEVARILGIEAEGDAMTLLAAIRDKIKALVGDENAAIAASVRTALGLPATANADAVMLALSVRSSGGGETVTELGAMKEAEAQRVAKERVEVYIRSNQLNPNDKPAYEAALRLAMSDPTTLDAIFKNAAPYAAPGRTTPPTTRQMTIIRAEREFEGNPKHGRITSVRAFVDNSLREAGMTRLSDDEARELVTA